MLDSHAYNEWDDPGEHQVTLSSGVLFGGGGAFSRPPGEKGMMALSVETTLHWGRRATSHDENPPLLPLVNQKQPLSRPGSHLSQPSTNVFSPT